jgi:chromosome partitioning protein
MNNLIEQAKVVNPTLKSLIVINRASTNTMISETQEAKDVLSDFENLNLFKGVIKDRVAFRKAAKGGESVFELPKIDEKSCQEIEDLFMELFNDQ